MTAHPVKERRNKIMCGIVGYVGAKECTAILVNSLTKLEYRGYDSAGIAVFEGDRIKTVKAKGKLKEGLIKKLENEPHFTATARSASAIPAGQRTASRATLTLTR